MTEINNGGESLFSSGAQSLLLTCQRWTAARLAAVHIMTNVNIPVRFSRTLHFHRAVVPFGMTSLANPHRAKAAKRRHRGSAAGARRTVVPL